jgi:hypothetical protein
MKQVALKAAIELTKDKFDFNDVGANQQLNLIKDISDNLFNYLKEGVEQAVPTVQAPFEQELKSFTPKCPECKSDVEDNREKIKSDPKFAKIPVFSCTNKKGCDTGKGYSWATWNEDEFANQEIQASKDLPF